MCNGKFSARTSALAFYNSHRRRYSASVILAITYGKTTPTAYTDPEVISIKRCFYRAVRAARPGAYLVDAYPILKCVPYYPNTLRQWHHEELTLFRSYVDVIRQEMVCHFILAPNQYKHINRPWEKQDRPLPSISWKTKQRRALVTMSSHTSLDQCLAEGLIP